MANQVYIGTWNDVVDEPKFSAQINGGNGSMTLRLARSIFNYNTSTDIILGYYVEVWCYDDDDPQGKKIYHGIINSYRPIVEAGNEFIEIVLYSPMSTLANQLAMDRNDNTKFTETGDHGTIIRNLVDRYGGIITTTADSVELTGQSITYQFNTMTWLDAIKKVVELAPSGWYFYVDADNILHFKARRSTSLHKVTLGREVKLLDFANSIEDLKNHVVVIGGGTPALYYQYEDADSIESYGRRTELIYDTNITTEANASAAAQKILAERGSITTDVKLQIIDSNGTEEFLGYDIESIYPGETLQILGLGNADTQTLWDVAIWDQSFWDFSIQNAAAQTMQITQVDYTPDYVSLGFTRKNYEIGSYIDYLNRKLQNYTNKDNPTAPS